MGQHANRLLAVAILLGVAWLIMERGPKPGSGNRASRVLGEDAPVAEARPRSGRNPSDIDALSAAAPPEQRPDGEDAIAAAQPRPEAPKAPPREGRPTINHLFADRDALLDRYLLALGPVEGEGGELQRALQALDRNRAGLAAGLLRKLWRRDREDNVRSFWLNTALLMLAKQRINEGDLDAALEEVERARDFHGGDALAEALAGYLHRRRGEAERCSEAFGRARELAPEEPYHPLSQGFCAAEADQLAVAADAFGRYLELAPEDAQIEEMLDRQERRQEVEKDFEELRSGRFQVKFAPPLRDFVLEQLVPMLEDAWRSIGRSLGHFPDGTLGVVVYADKSAYRHATGAPAWMGAIFDGRVRIPVNPEGVDLDRLQRVVRHEMTHFVLRDVAGSRVPQWLHEGLAQHLAGEEGPRHWETYALFASTGQSIPIASIEASFGVFDKDTASRVYHQSVSMARHIIERYGGRALESLVEAYAEGKQTKAAFDVALNVGVAEFQRRWFDALRSEVQARGGR